MFILTKISDTVPIVPAHFEKRTRQALQDNLNEKFANKIIQQVGLCICVYDILKSSDGLIDARTSDGTVHVNVTFRLVVFRPFKGEIIEGRIKSTSDNGIKLSLAFFDDMLAPPENLFQPNKIDRVVIPPKSAGAHSTTEVAFVWINDGQDLFFDNNEMVRFKVEDELWQDQAVNTKREAKIEAGAAKAAQGIERTDGAGAAMGHSDQERVKAEHAPWRLFVSMEQAGLGLLTWW